MTLPRYSTRQRKLLLDYLSAHPHQLLSAGEIARDLREREVSLSAVYRNLAQLEAEVWRLEQEIASPEAAADYLLLQDLCAQVEEKREALSKAEDRWLELSEG